MSLVTGSHVGPYESQSCGGCAAGGYGSSIWNAAAPRVWPTLPGRTTVPPFHRTPSAVYVQDFPAPKRKYRVTSNGGARVWWRADSRQLLILNADWTQLLAADVRPGPVFSAEVPQPVGQLPNGIVALEVAPNATRVLAVLNDGSDAARSATVVLSWTSALEKR